MIDKIAWLHILHHKLLVVRSKNKAVFYMPGGKRENGETDVETLIREIKEELNVQLTLDSIRHDHTFLLEAHGASPGTMVQMACYQADFIGELHPSHEIAEIAWVGMSDLEKCSKAVQSIMLWLQEQARIA